LRRILYWVQFMQSWSSLCLAPLKPEMEGEEYGCNRAESSLTFSRLSRFRGPLIEPSSSRALESLSELGSLDKYLGSSSSLSSLSKPYRAEPGLDRLSSVRAQYVIKNLKEPNSSPSPSPIKKLFEPLMSNSAHLGLV